MISKKMFFIACLLTAGLAAGLNIPQSISGDVPVAADTNMMIAIPPDEEGWAEDAPEAPEDVPAYRGEEAPSAPVPRAPTDQQVVPVPQAP